MPLDDAELVDLENLISDSFRVHQNRDPIYVDISGHLNRLASKQHQIIFGRRGSGKSCLLVHYHRQVAPGSGVLTVYLNADEIKQLRFPDIIIRTLITLFEALPGGGMTSCWRKAFGRSTALQRETSVLRELLDRADQSEVTEAVERGSTTNAETGVDVGNATFGASSSESAATKKTSMFSEEKADHLDRHLQDYKRLLRESISGSRFEHAAFLVDDFYQVRRSDQPELIDYLHRLLRGTDFYLKIGTIRHRTVLTRSGAQTVGVEVGQDVEALNLDRTLEDVPVAQAYLCGILNAMGSQVGIDDTVGTYLNRTAPLDLTLASGGVPRDFLTIFVEALRDARDRGSTRWITPTNIYRGAARVSYRSKIDGLRADVGPESVNELEVLFQDILTFCIKEKGKTAFLISQTDAGQLPHEHDLLQELTDLKLIHVVVPDTSAASGREGRYEAYMLDAQSFMEPRRRNIEIVEFWKTDDQRRPVGIREAPTYSLSRASEVLADGSEPQLDALIEEELSAGFK